MSRAAVPRRGLAYRFKLLLSNDLRRDFGFETDYWPGERRLGFDPWRPPGQRCRIVRMGTLVNLKSMPPNSVCNAFWPNYNRPNP